MLVVNGVPAQKHTGKGAFGNAEKPGIVCDQSRFGKGRGEQTVGLTDGPVQSPAVDINIVIESGAVAGIEAFGKPACGRNDCLLNLRFRKNLVIITQSFEHDTDLKIVVSLLFDAEYAVQTADDARPGAFVKSALFNGKVCHRLRGFAVLFISGNGIEGG